MKLGVVPRAVIAALGRTGSRDGEFEVSLSYVDSLFSSKLTNNINKNKIKPKQHQTKRKTK